MKKASKKNALQVCLLSPHPLVLTEFARVLTNPAFKIATKHLESTLGPDLRHIMPEHDDIVLFAGLILHMVAQQRLGLESQAFKNRDGAGLIDRHLHDQLFEAGA